MKDIYLHFYGDWTVFSRSVAVTTSCGCIALGWVPSFILGGTQVQWMCCCIQWKFSDFVSNSELESENRFWQFIAENFDHNKDTTTGVNTTHVMSIISGETLIPELTMFQPIKKEYISLAKLFQAAKFNDNIKVCSKPSKSSSSS